MSKFARSLWLLCIFGLGLAVSALVLLVVTAPGSVSSADAVCTINWTGPSTGGVWSTAANWDLNRAPQTGDVVCATGVTWLRWQNRHSTATVRRKWIAFSPNPGDRPQEWLSANQLMGD